MKKIVFITGNQHKADYLAHWLRLPVTHHKLDLDELQSLDPFVVAEHKARQAYEILQEPVLVEDTSLRFTAMGRLPGTLIKWFLGEVGNSGLCKIADGLGSREAHATVTYGYCDGRDVHFFVGTTQGSVAKVPRGEHGMGFDPSFIPDGQSKTFAEMTVEELEPFSPRAKAILKLKEFLEQD